MNTKTTTYGRGAVVGISRRDALAKLRKEQLAGRIHSAGELSLITTGERAGQYAIPVYLIEEPRRQRGEMPVYARVAVVLASAALLIGMTGLVLVTLSGLALTALLVTVLAMFAIRLRITHGRPRGTTVTTTVTFR